MHNSPQFRGRRILVTGGSQGIGKEIAQLLAALGATVVVLARESEHLSRCVAELPGDTHQALAMDVGDQSSWQAAKASGALREVDGVVTAAAVLAPVGSIDTYTPEEFWQTMRINVLGTFMAIQTCAESLEEAGGAVVTFAGGGATSPHPMYDAYAASKAAVVRLSENLAHSLRERGIRVNSVSPGFVATAIHDATLMAGPDVIGENRIFATKQRLLAGGVSARPAAELTAFLMSTAAHGITGRLISAQWDPWREVAFQQRLRDEPDLATLRRIDNQHFASVRR